VEVGLLWFDDDKQKPLEAKIDEAVSAYCAKPRFKGKRPSVCRVHTSMLPDGEDAVRVNGLRVESVSTISPHYFFVATDGGGGDGRGPSRRGTRPDRGSRAE